MTDVPTSQTHASLWTDQQRQMLGAVADLLIPATDGMPSATAVDVQGDGIDEVGRLRSDLVAACRAIAAVVGDDMPGDLDDLRTKAGVHFVDLSELLASAYLLRPEVAKLTGYRQRLAIPLDDEDARAREFSELVAPVVARGNVWRSTLG